MPFGGTETSDTFETGTRAAAHGGTTCIVDFAIQTRGMSTIECLDAWHAKAAGRTAIDYAFHMVVTDLPDHRVPEMRRLADEGVTSYKLFMVYPGVMLSDDGTIFRAMRKADGASFVAGFLDAGRSPGPQRRGVIISRALQARRGR